MGAVNADWCIKQKNGVSRYMTWSNEELTLAKFKFVCRKVSCVLIASSCLLIAWSRLVCCNLSCRLNGCFCWYVDWASFMSYNFRYRLELRDSEKEDRRRMMMMNENEERWVR